MPKNMHIGIAWYRPEQWARLVAVSGDAESLEATFEEWEANARRAVARLRREGMDPRQVVVDVEDLIAWCNLENRAVDGEARSAYVSHLMRSQDGCT